MDKTTNEWKEDVVYVPIVIWGAAAERCKDRIRKGTPISVEGRLTMDEYTDKNTGQLRKTLQVTANRVQILESGAAGGAYNDGAQAAAKDDVPTTDVMEDDVPF
jgi:single-strand DNA-binding protein